MVNQVGEQPVDHQVEEIPADHYVSRHIDLPHKYADDAGLIWQRVFEFPGGVGESVVWRQYKPSVAEVHALGCDRQDLKRSQYPEKNPPWTYIGAMTAQVQQLRAIETRRGHGFVVEHKPLDDDGSDQGIYHAEITYKVHPDNPLNKNDKTELKELIQRVFGPLDTHVCA